MCALLTQSAHPAVQLTALQRAPGTGKWPGGRPGSQWAPLPWTYPELGKWKAAELAKARSSGDRYRVEQKFYRGKQVIKWWNEIYGNWSINGPGDPWALWFQQEMKPFGKFKFNPRTLWDRFLTRRGAQMGMLETESSVNPFGGNADTLRYEYYKNELEGRDPTSVEFNMDYHKFIDPRNPGALVDPPKSAQRYLIKSGLTTPLSTLGLKIQIDLLRKKLKKAGRLP